VPSNGLPPDVGCVCHNIGTAYAVKQAVMDAQPLISRVVTVTGPGIKHPRNLEVRLGTPISELIEQCGGYAEGASRLLMGGPMMGVALATDEMPVVKACNCILVMTEQQLDLEGNELPCIRCGDCANACPSGLLPQQLHWYGRNSDMEQLVEHSLFDCIECGCCDLVCPSHIPLTQSFRDSKTMIWSRERSREKSDRARRRFLDRELRLAEENAAKKERRAKRQLKQNQGEEITK
jgi:electron transport complex protein RnfC